MSKTTILVNHTTRNKLKQAGTKGETYDEVINKLLEFRTLGASGSK